MKHARPHLLDPPSARSTRKPVLDGSVFDQQRLMSFVRAGLVEACPPLPYPNDELLIATVVEAGMPRWSADQMRYNPTLRYHYLRFWLDVHAASEGDPEAKDRVEVARATWQEMRAAELVHDQPDMSVGFWER